METKTLKIEVPDGYEIDKEKSTFENIVFKKVDGIVIKWNKNYNGVEIKADGEHFILDANPSYTMSWNDAIRFYSNKHRSHTWDLPTIKQLQIVYKYFDKINEVIENNGGFVLYKSLYWSIEEKSNSFAHIVSMYNGNINDMCECNYNFVRAVSTL
jgi:hypothetical protein